MNTLPGLRFGEGNSVLVIGLDGATLDLMSPLMEQGVMPNLRRIVDSGCHGPLNSTMPPVTAPAWSSFFTGKNPGKHGVYDFWAPLRAGVTRRLNDSRSIVGAKIWDVLGRNGKTVGLFNLPMTYPVPQVEGYAIGGMLSTRLDESFAYPYEIMPLVTGDEPYVIDIEPLTYVERGARDAMLRDLISMTRRRIDIGVRLLSDYPPDLFMVVFVSTDRIQHFFWHILDPSHPRHDVRVARELLPRINECYSLIDEGIGRLVDAAKPSAATIVMSDHGFGPAWTHVDIEAWLRNQGYLKYRSGLPMARRLLATCKMESLAWKGLGILQKGKKVSPALAQIRDVMLDWEGTNSYRGDSAGYSVYLNVKGREPFGRIEPGREYEAAVDAIASGLQALESPEDGSKVIRHVYRTRDVYHGPRSCDAPDILLSFEPGYKGCKPQYSNRVLWPGSKGLPVTGTHQREGLIAMSGQRVAHQPHVISAEIIDVAPTILHLMDLPVPDDMDGKVIGEALADASQDIRLSESVKWATAGSAVTSNGHAYSEQEEQEVRERLRRLGYID